MKLRHAIPLLTLTIVPVVSAGQALKLTRAEFAARMSALQQGDTMEKVKRQLGAPDETVVDKGGDGAPATVTWRYGVLPLTKLASLGTVTFEHNKMERTVGGYGKPPSPAVISEKELRAAMDAIYEPGRFRASSDPLHRVRSTNFLQKIGTDKARATLSETSRVIGNSFDDLWLFWLAFTLFDLPKSTGYLPTPLVGALRPQPPERRVQSPRFPVIVVDDVPFLVPTGLMINGNPETFTGYMDRLPTMTLVRASPLRPPDDPFNSVAKLVRSREWAVIYIDEGIKLPMGDAEGMLSEVLQLVRTAYQVPAAKSRRPSVSWKDFDRHHQAYLKLGCRWDEKEQCYVRRDGSHDKIEPLK